MNELHTYFSVAQLAGPTSSLLNSKDLTGHMHTHTPAIHIHIHTHTHTPGTL